ncbi:hypothetical protein PRIPAC_94960 [Pristionchus pacificus]|uniref:Uncharacterized protein n=1 Tax=Pristionchus pacificus TaxID=54126 RepID=A0A2A6BPY6_PRIPA|nr:hypothetical protein PRIPAC_94960 [Pristionchus pacificus]|eukprot:PDM68012.1 hypothetical protein PRIPAC_46056 [Pristionchus pacificus]
MATSTLAKLAMGPAKREHGNLMAHGLSRQDVNCTTYPNGTSSQPDDAELMWFLGKFGIHSLTR